MKFSKKVLHLFLFYGMIINTMGIVFGIRLILKFLFRCDIETVSAENSNKSVGLEIF